MVRYLSASFATSVRDGARDWFERGAAAAAAWLEFPSETVLYEVASFLGGTETRFSFVTDG